METKGKDDKLPGFLQPRVKAFAMPREVFEVASGFVMATRVERGRLAQVRRAASAELEAGIVEPSPLQLNVANPEPLIQKLRSLAKSIRARGRSCALLVPDGAARVAILSFESVPAKRKEMDQLIRWRMKESLGFAPEQARLTYQAVPDGAALELLVVALKQDVLAQYESVFDSLKIEAQLVLPSTFALLPLLSEEGEGGQLLTHLVSGWVTHAVVTGNRLRLWRAKPVEGGNAQERIASVVSEAARARASVEDRMGIHIERAWLCARPEAEAGLVQELERSLGRSVTPMAPDHKAALPLEEDATFKRFGAPVAGLMMNCGGVH
jgi:type IV pilus assembly protein PilM